MLRRLILVFVLAAVGSGCAGGCPDVQLLDSSAEPPGLVQMLFSVECEGEPVTAVEAADVTLAEGGTDVSSSESDWRLDPVTAALETYTLLLMDVSDSIIDQGTLETAQEVATSFASTLVDQGQQVSVAVFDGDPEIRTVVGFTDDMQELEDAIDGIGPEDQLDGSTNLNGAVLAGLAVLDEVVSPSVEAELVSVANMGVFTDGVDRAGRETHTKAVNQISSSEHDVFVVALISSDEDAEELEDLGDDGFFRADDVAQLTETFDDLISRLIAEVNKYYRISYCSPLRSPQTKLKLTVTWQEATSSVAVSYKTKDFGPGCSLPAAGS